MDEPDSLLVELVADAVEDLCGFKPVPDDVEEFISAQLGARQASDGPTAQASPIQQPRLPRSSRQQPASQQHVNIPQPNGPFGFELEGRWFSARNGRDVLTKLLEELARRDPTFLERFANRPHGRRRRYIARNREELYPDRPDLSQQSMQLSTGWWVGTNYSRNHIKKILQLACESSGLTWGQNIKVYIAT